MATNSSNSGASKLQKPGRLRQTLTELESALTSWDQIVPDGASAVSSTPDPAARARNSGVSEEMKRRTRELLDQLKEQIEELSSEESPSN